MRNFFLISLKGAVSHEENNRKSMGVGYGSNPLYHDYSHSGGCTHKKTKAKCEKDDIENGAKKEITASKCQKGKKSNVEE